MSQTRHGVVVLTAALDEAGLDRAAVVELMGEALLDETEGSLTAAWDEADEAQAIVDNLVGRGLVEGTSVFAVQVEIPVWLEAYNDVAGSMLEHGG